MATNPGRGSGAKRVLIWLAVAIVAALGAYGYGRWQGIVDLRAAQSSAAERRAAVQQDIGAVRSESADLSATNRQQEALIRQLEARRQLHLTLMELDQRNF